MNGVKLRRPIIVGMKRKIEDLPRETFSDDEQSPSEDEQHTKKRSLLDDSDELSFEDFDGVRDLDLESDSLVLPDDDDCKPSPDPSTSDSSLVENSVPSVACVAVETPGTATAPTTAAPVSIPMATPPALVIPDNSRPLTIAPQPSLSLAVGPNGQLFVVAPTVAATDMMTNATRRSMALRAASMASSMTLAAPSCSTAPSTSSSLSTLVREDRRRITHNEVERRRRDKINTLIMKLADIIPDCPTSKSDILCRACDYVVELQDLLIRLQNKLSEVQPASFQEKLAELRKENEILRAVLEQHGILLPGEGSGNL